MTNQDDLFRFTTGPRTSRVVIVGEAWGANEAAQRKPFVGHSGMELNRMLAEAGMSRDACLCTNVIPSQPPGNAFPHFLHTNEEAKRGGTTDYADFFPKPELSSSIRNLWSLLAAVSPDLVIGTGNIPLHILTPHASTSTQRGYKLPTGITSWRGSQTYTRSTTSDPKLATRFPLPEKPYRYLPIIHPAAILRDWGQRSPTVHDLRSRANRYLTGLTGWEAPPTNDIFRPSYDDVTRALNLWLAVVNTRPLWLSVDIETYARTYISCIGLSDNELALCIPFFYFVDNRTRAYWTLEQEIEIWLRLRNLLEHPNVRVIGQNYIYDSIFLKRYAGINTLPAFDTMVAHHLLYPGTPMGLHYLASLYCDHHLYWKDESEEWAAGELSAEDLWRYNCKDLRKTFECRNVLQQLIDRKGYQEQFSWRMREWRLARKMALKGVNDDNELRKQFRTDCIEQANILQEWLLNAVPKGWQYAKSGKPWYASNQMIMYILYDRLGLTPILHKKTKQPTADDEALETLIARKDTKYLKPLLQHLQALRSLGVFDSHFLDIKLGPGGRLYTQFNIARPETFRWSSSANPLEEGTNLQNLPKVQED